MNSTITAASKFAKELNNQMTILTQKKKAFNT